MSSYTFLTLQGTKQFLKSSAYVAHRTSPRVVSFTLSRWRAAHVNLSLCPSLHCISKEQQGMLDLSVHRCRANLLLGGCRFGQNHTDLPSRRSAWQCDALPAHPRNGQAGFWTHQSLRLRQPSSCSDFPFPGSHAKTLPLDAARNVSTAETWRELPGVRFGFQSSACERRVGIFPSDRCWNWNQKHFCKRRLRCSNNSVLSVCIIYWREWSCFVLLEFKKE